MSHLLSISAAVFMYSLVWLLLGVKDDHSRNIYRRLHEIKRLRRYGSKIDSDKRGNRKINLSWLRVPKGLERDLKTSGIKMTTQEFAAMWIIAAVFPPLILLLSKKAMSVCCVTAVLGAFIPPVIVSRIRKKRVDRFQNQLGETLLILSNTLRAGFTFERALLSVADGLPSPIREELLQTGNEIQVGTSIEEAMDAMAVRMQNGDLQLVTSAVLIQKRVGGNLADVLERISETVKERIRIQRNIKTLTSQGRTSAQVVGVLPFALIGVVSVTMPGYMSPLFEFGLGRILLILAVVMESIGFFIMMRMTNIKY